MNGLIKLEARILVLYRRLCSLEIKGEKGTKKYFNILEDLKKKLKEEECLLKSLNLGSLSFNKLQSGLEISSKIDKSIESRILSRLADGTIKEISEKIGSKVVEDYDKILKEIHINVDMFTAKFLNELIQNENNAVLKEKMISSFYEFCYLQPRLGSLLLEDSFEMKDECFKSCYFVADVLGLRRDKCQNLIDDSCVELLVQEFGRLFYNREYENQSDLDLHYNLVTCTFKALSVMLSDDGYERAKKAMFHSMDENKLLNNMHYDFVCGLFSEKNRPKEKIVTMTFGKPLE